jgi:hypothetical protein
MTQGTSLTDELTGTNVIQTDHDGFTFTDLAVLLLDGVLFIYTAWRSYHFLSSSVPDDMAIMAMIGLWGLDIGMIIWSLVWMFGSTEKYQDWTAMSFFLIDMAGVVLTSLTDSLLFSDPDGSMTAMLQGIAAPAIPLIVVANVIAGFIYHMTSPKTRARRDDRRAKAEFLRKMETVSKNKRDLVYAETLIMAKQEELEKTALLAEIKVAQDALEQATRAKLRDQVGIHEAAKGRAEEKKDENAGLVQHLKGLKDALKSLNESDTAPAAPVPAQPNDSPAPPQADASPIVLPDMHIDLSQVPEPTLTPANTNGHKPAEANDTSPS